MIIRIYEGIIVIDVSMIVTDCYWEKDVLGCQVAEVSINLTDRLTCTDLSPLHDYNYIVVKVPMQMVESNIVLSNMGYAMVEVQCKLSKVYNSFDFDDKLIRVLYPDVSFSEISEDVEFYSLLDSITPGMFTTDRISLDPSFGREKGCLRYKHWMEDSFKNNTASFMSIKYNDKPIGFSMYKSENGVIEGILGGIFEKFQSEGLGLLTPTRHFLDAHKKGTPFKKYKTSISSNNVAVWRFYNHFNFKIDQLFYVFVKHQ